MSITYIRISEGSKVKTLEQKGRVKMEKERVMWLEV